MERRAEQEDTPRVVVICGDVHLVVLLCDEGLWLLAAVAVPRMAYRRYG